VTASTEREFRYRMPGGLVAQLLAAAFLVGFFGFFVFFAFSEDAVFVAITTVLCGFAAYETLFTLSYAAELEGETIRFRALARRRRVYVRSIRRISIAGAGDSTRFKVQFEGGSTRLVYCRSSRAFVTDVVRVNRAVETEGFDRSSGERTRKWW
jgi:hypothetical protein